MSYQSTENSQFIEDRIYFNEIYFRKTENSLEQSELQNLFYLTFVILNKQQVSLKFSDNFRGQSDQNYQSNQIEDHSYSATNIAQIKYKGDSKQINENQDSPSNENEQQIQNEEEKQLKLVQYSFQFIKQQKLFQAPKFYLFMDQVFDFDFFSNYSNKDKYLKERPLVQQHKNMRFINKLTHRQDNKFIEIDMEFFPSSIYNIEQIISLLYSFGNRDLLILIKNLQLFWEKIQIYKQLIIEQYEDPLFQKHYERRKQASKEQFDKLTSNLNQNRLIFYLNTSVNYEKQLYESDKAGYSPGLYEILDINSYSFKNYLQSNGYYDPRTNIFQLEQCFNIAIQSVSIMASKHTFYQKEEINMKQEIRTIDGFVFPVLANGYLYNLNFDYDQENNLSLQMRDFLFVMDFSFLDLSIHEKFKIYREQQQYQQFKPVTIYNDDEFFDEQVDYEKTKFFKKYYDDQIDNLVAKGSKWFKRCGYADIPSKKKIEIQEEIDIQKQ